MDNWEIINTPGYFYSLAYCISSLVVFVGYRKRNSSIKNIFISILYVVTLVAFMIITDGINPILFLPCILISISLIFLFIYRSCKLSFIQAGFYCVRSFIAGEFIASLTWQLILFLDMNNIIDFNFESCMLCIVIMYFLSFCIFYLIEKSYFDFKKIKIHKKEFTTVVLIAFSVFLISNLNYIYYNTSLDYYITKDFFTIRTLVDLSGVVVLYAYHIQKNELHSKHEVYLLQNILNIQYLNYKMMEESIDIVNQKYHDLKHQINLLKQEVVTEESLEYLNKMEEEIRIYEVHIHSGHPVIDTVLTAKSLHCKNNSISFTCVVDGNSLFFIDDMDICALFGNLLDNSIEAVEKLENVDERIIHLTVSKKKNFLSIKVSNQCDNDEYLKNKIPKTTKKNKNFHGFGLKSIQSIVFKYDGVVSTEIVDKTFNVRILIPIESS